LARINPVTSHFAARRIALATMHGKAQAIAPAFGDALGALIVATTDVDTDRLGTFTGEVPRAGSMLDAAVAKARLGMTALGLPLGVASEGAFGPHPMVPMLASGTELMVFVDDERGLVIEEAMSVERTNFAHCTAATGDDIGAFLTRAGFPSHGLLVRAHRLEASPGLPNGAAASAALVKGIQNRDGLIQAIDRAAALSTDGRAWIETDMRAHFNPTRMESIRTLARRLAERLATPCPSCTAPGWGRVGTTTGLPCEDCGMPTGRVLFERYGCLACGHEGSLPRSDGLTHSSTTHCPACNP
jgi:hypothetical protein